MPRGTGERAGASEDGARAEAGVPHDGVHDAGSDEEVGVSSDDEDEAVEADVVAFDTPSAAQRDVRDLLRAAAARDTAMPDDVVARLDAALAAARTDTGVASLDRRRQRVRRWNRALAAAAAGVVVLGGGVALAQHGGLPGGGAGSSSAGSSAGGPSRDLARSGRTAAPDGARAGTDPVVLASGADYGDPAALAAGASAVVAAAAPSAGSDHTLLSAPQAATGAQPDPAVAQALSCAQALGVDPAGVVGVDLAQWRGTPAAVVVVPAGTDAVQVTVLARDCVPGSSALAEQTVATPAR